MVKISPFWMFSFVKIILQNSPRHVYREYDLKHTSPMMILLINYSLKDLFNSWETTKKSPSDLLKMPALWTGSWNNELLFLYCETTAISGICSFACWGESRNANKFSGNFEELEKYWRTRVSGRLVAKLAPSPSLLWPTNMV